MEWRNLLPGKQYVLCVVVSKQSNTILKKLCNKSIVFWAQINKQLCLVVDTDVINPIVSPVSLNHHQALCLVFVYKFHLSYFLIFSPEQLPDTNLIKAKEEQDREVEILAASSIVVIFQSQWRLICWRRNLCPSVSLVRSLS